MFKKLRKRRSSNNFIPFSKKLLGYSRWECWIMTFAIFLMTIFRIETGDLYQIVLTGWAGYGVAKALYYNMAKSDHQIQLIREIDPKADEKIKSIIKDNLVEKLKEAIIQELKVEEVEADNTKNKED
jgi:hypothetical protein